MTQLLMLLEERKRVLRKQEKTAEAIAQHQATNPEAAGASAAAAAAGSGASTTAALATRVTIKLETERKLLARALEHNSEQMSETLARLLELRISETRELACLDDAEDVLLAMRPL